MYKIGRTPLMLLIMTLRGRYAHTYFWCHVSFPKFSEKIQNQKVAWLPWILHIWQQIDSQSQMFLIKKILASPHQCRYLCSKVNGDRYPKVVTSVIWVWQFFLKWSKSLSTLVQTHKPKPRPNLQDQNKVHNWYF